MRLLNIRVILRTFAVGIAAAWFFNEFTIAWRDKAVALPSENEDVLYIFPIESKDIDWSPGGGAETEHLCPPYALSDRKPTLTQIKSFNRSELRFKFMNDTGCDIYMVYAPIDLKTKEASFPYWMECIDKNGRFHPVVEYDFIPPMKILKSGDYFIFVAFRHASKGPCTIRVTYHRDPKAYEIFNGPDPFAAIAPEHESMIKKSLRRVQLSVAK